MTAHQAAGAHAESKADHEREVERQARGSLPIRIGRGRQMSGSDGDQNCQFWAAMAWCQDVSPAVPSALSVLVAAVLLLVAADLVRAGGKPGQGAMAKIAIGQLGGVDPRAQDQDAVSSISRAGR
jgi:hypothetical protein